MNQKVLKMVLKKCGIMNPTVVDDGEAAVQAQTQGRFEMIFMVRRRQSDARC